MHMADALLSPAVGGTMLAISGGAIALAAKKITADPEIAERQVPLMSVLGAFVFAAQMLNFAIPGTGSSGHIGGGILLAALLGAAPALLVIAAVLLIQCLFFADGGLLAYGANVFNMGICASVIAYRLVYLPLLGNAVDQISPRRISIAAIGGAIIGMQFGAFAVVLETYFSGRTELPFSAFVLAMQPIHLVIGSVEGIATALLLRCLYRTRPELLTRALPQPAVRENFTSRRGVMSFAAAAIFFGGGLSIFASSLPDGLEWSIAKVSGENEIVANSVAHRAAEQVAQTTVLMPEYQDEKSSPTGTAIAGLLGSAIAAIGVGGIGCCLYRSRQRRLDAAEKDPEPVTDKS